MDNTLGAYTEGFNNGYGIAIENSIEATFDEDKFVSMCMEVECEHFRQFSPFEFTAKEFNDAEYPDEMWEEYERGVENGIKTAYQRIIRESEEE